jgi:hypothetical protein
LVSNAAFNFTAARVTPLMLASSSSSSVPDLDGVEDVGVFAVVVVVVSEEATVVLESASEESVVAAEPPHAASKAVERIETVTAKRRVRVLTAWNVPDASRPSRNRRTQLDEV